MRPTVIEALRRFLPEFLKSDPPLSSEQRRAIWAISRCRTPALGGQGFACKKCSHVHFAYHSCNHKACPQCGAGATRRWIQQQLEKRIDAPYFLVTFTVPSELRDQFFGPLAKQAYELFFAAVSGALSQKLADDKSLRAHVSGFIATLHTWNQRLEFHPHIHCLVPGAGLDDEGKLVRAAQADFLVYLPHLQAAFRQHMRQLLEQHQWQVDPIVWTKDWGVHIQPAGCGAAALKYLGAYVARTAISNARIVAVSDHSVSFRWKDRAQGNRTQILELSGIEFVRRYLRHVLPSGLRSTRYYGFCHPAAKAKRLRVQLHCGMTVQLGSTAQAPEPASFCPPCPKCGGPSQWLITVTITGTKRGPPVVVPKQDSKHSAPIAA